MVTAPTHFSMRAIIGPLVAIIFGVFMVVLDSTAMNVALPSLVTGLHGPLSTLQWTITGYVLAQATVIPLAGWLSDRFGAKRVFLSSVALFTFGSILCATAQDSTMLIAFRVLQGLGGGMVAPIAIAFTYRLSPPERVGAVMGIMGIPILFAPALGPVVAGWLVQYASWRWIFLVNLPVGIVGLLIGLRCLPAIDRQRVAGLDLPGMVLGPLAFAALCYGVSQGSTSWTSPETLGGLVVGALALVTFAGVELRAQAPLLELRVFRSVHFSLGIVAQWIGQCSLFGTLFLVPLFLEQARGYGAFDTGLSMLPYAIAAAICMPLGGSLSDRIGARPLVVAGLGLIAGAVAILSHVDPATQGSGLIVPLVMTGAGMGLMFMTLTTYLLKAAPRHLVGRVTSLTNSLQQVITSLSIAGLATIVTTRAATHASADRALPHGGAAHLGHELGLAVHAALVMGFADTFRVLIVAAAAGAVLALALRRPRPAPAAVAFDSAETEDGLDQGILLAG